MRPSALLYLGLAISVAPLLAAPVPRRGVESLPAQGNVETRNLQIREDIGVSSRSSTSEPDERGLADQVFGDRGHDMRDSIPIVSIDIPSIPSIDVPHPPIVVSSRTTTPPIKPSLTSPSPSSSPTFINDPDGSGESGALGFFSLAKAAAKIKAGLRRGDSN